MEKVYKRETPHTKFEFGTIDFDADCVNEFIERFNEQYRSNGGFVTVGDFKRILRDMGALMVMDWTTETPEDYRLGWGHMISTLDFETCKTFSRFYYLLRMPKPVLVQ